MTVKIDSCEDLVGRLRRRTQSVWSCHWKRMDWVLEGWWVKGERPRGGGRKANGGAIGVATQSQTKLWCLVSNKVVKEGIQGVQGANSGHSGHGIGENNSRAWDWDLGVILQEVWSPLTVFSGEVTVQPTWKSSTAFSVRARSCRGSAGGYLAESGGSAAPQSI